MKKRVYNVIKETYKAQAIKSGKDAKVNYDVSTPALLYKTLNNYILDGMPCDNVNNVTINEEERLQWQVVNCLHRGYWENVNGDASVLYELREIWISNFITNANPEFTYSFNIQDINGQKVLVHEINKL